MKYIYILAILMFCLGCSPRHYVRNRTNKLIENSHKMSDTIYVFSTNNSKNAINVLWYHHDNHIYSFLVEPYKVKKIKQYAQNIYVCKDSIHKYFDIRFDKDIECFTHTLDGDFIKVYVKNKDTLFTSIDTHCLFNKKYEKGSLPFKLQYDISRVFLPVNDFEKLYLNQEKKR